MLPVHARQTIKRAINFTRSSDFWRDDTASPPCQCLTAAQQRKREFLFTDGHQTAATSESSMLTLAADPLSPESLERIQQMALDSRPKTSAAMGQDETGEEKKK